MPVALLLLWATFSAQANTHVQEPENAQGWLSLARTYAKNKMPDQALEAARKAEALGATDPGILKNLADFYATLVPDPSKAAELGERYAEKSPQDKTAWRRLAAFCLQAGLTDRAIAAGTRGLTVDDGLEVRRILGAAYTRRGDFSNAAAQMSEVVKLNPYDEQARFELARVYLIEQDFPSAARVLEDARKTFDKSAQIELALGVAYYGQRKFSEAVQQFLRTMDLAPDVPQPYVFLGRIMDHATDRLPELTARFADFERRNPGSYLGYVLHAKALIAQLPASGFPAEAQTALELVQKSLALKEDEAESHYLAGVLLERKREYAKAAAELERSIQLNGNESAAHYRLARVYDHLGRREDAERQRALHEKLSEEEKAPARNPAAGLLK
jgi:tetratricopeptide (TPR) repeat protein